jgi:hypothetical protein
VDERCQFNLLASNSLALIGRIGEAFPDAPGQCGGRDYIANAEAETHVLLNPVMICWHILNEKSEL